MSSALLLTSCASQTMPVTGESFLLDTLIKVEVHGAPGLGEKNVKQTIDTAFARAAKVESRLDIHHAGSETNRLNRLAGGPPGPVSNDMWAALTTGKTVWRQTKGAFDLTIGPVTQEWGGGEKKRIPGAKRLRAALRAVGGENLALASAPQRTAGLTKPDMQLDLGSVTKGLAVDRIAEILRRRGLDNSLINGVSSIKAVGSKPNGRPWRIGIQSPRPKTTPGMIAVIELRRGSISTSGDYQRTFTVRGRRYHHVIDPRTGRPAPGFMSVTVVTTKSAAYADALSTGLAVMGRKKALRLVEELRGVDAFFVDASGRFWVSSGLESSLEKIHPRVL